MNVYASTFEPEPRIMVRGNLQTPKDAYLIVEKTKLCKVSNFDTIGLLILSTFYVFNMIYTKGLNNFFCFMESSFMEKKVPKDKFRVSQLMSLLSA